MQPKNGRDISIGNISLLKSINVLSNYGSTLFLGIYWKVALSAYGGSSVIALSKSTKAYKRRNLLFSSINPTESDLFNVFSNSKAIKKAFDYRIKSIEKEEIDLKRSNTFKNLAVFDESVAPAAFLEASNATHALHA